MAYRLCERTKLRRGLMPRSYQVTARLAVDAVWAMSGSSRQIFAKAFEPVSFAARLGPKWPGAIIAVSFAVHRSAAGVFRAKVFGARFPTASWGGSADRIAAGANSIRLDADVGLPVLQDQHPDNDTLCLLGG